MSTKRKSPYTLLYIEGVVFFMSNVMCAQNLHFNDMIWRSLLLSIFIIFFINLFHNEAIERRKTRGLMLNKTHQSFKPGWNVFMNENISIVYGLTPSNVVTLMCLWLSCSNQIIESRKKTQEYYQILIMIKWDNNR